MFHFPCSSHACSICCTSSEQFPFSCCAPRRGCSGCSIFTHLKWSVFIHDIYTQITKVFLGQTVGYPKSHKCLLKAGLAARREQTQRPLSPHVPPSGLCLLSLSCGWYHGDLTHGSCHVCCKEMLGRGRCLQWGWCLRPERCLVCTCGLG